jgi:hypothetical protein
MKLECRIVSLLEEAKTGYAAEPRSAGFKIASPGELK